MCIDWEYILPWLLVTLQRSSQCPNRGDSKWSTLNQGLEQCKLEAPNNPRSPNPRGNAQNPQNICLQLIHILRCS